MDKIKVLIRLEAYNLYKLACNPKVYVVCLLTWFFLEIIYGGLGDYLLQNDTAVQAFELYIFSMFSKGIYLVSFIGGIVLFCDAPFADRDTMQRVMRTTKSLWLAAQIIYVAAVSVIYQLFIQLCLLLAVKGRVTFSNQWSDTIWKAVQLSPEQIGILPMVNFFYGIIENGSPVQLFFISLILSVCLSVLFGMVFMAFNLFRGNQMSFVIVLLLWFGDFIYGYTSVLPSVFGSILPFSMYQSAVVRGGMEWLVSVVRLCGYIAILAWVSARFLKHYDFLELEKCR